MEKILFILGITILCIVTCKRYNLPSIIAYLIIGCAMGPFALGIIHNSEQIQLLAEVGVAFLLFTIGLELPIARFLDMRYNLLLIGGAQVVFCTLILGIGMYFIIGNFLVSWIVASGLAMSSTAIVMRQLSEQNELFARHGQLAFAMLIFQDIAAVPLLILLPFLAEANATGWDNNLTLMWTMLGILAEGTIIFIIILLLSKTVIKSIFHKIVLTRSLELFMLMVLFIALAAAVISESLELSMTFGAFVAGIGLGESQYRHQIDAEIRPFRDILLGIFFISVGMMLDLTIVRDSLGLVLLGVLAIFVVKCLLIFIICYVLGRQVNFMTAVNTGLIMAHAGEFGLAILALGKSYGIIVGATAQITLAAIIISLFVAVICSKYKEQIIRILLRNHYIKQLHQRETESSNAELNSYKQRENTTLLNDHIIICGFGRVGKTLAKFLTQEGQSYICLDLNPKVVQQGILEGYNIFFGDANRRNIMDSVYLNDSKLIVICVDDDATAKKITGCIRSLNLQLPILVRTRDFKQRDALIELGANEIIAETFEASMMLALHMFLLLGLSPDDAVQSINRANKEELFLDI